MKTFTVCEREQSDRWLNNNTFFVFKKNLSNPIVLASCTILVSLILSLVQLRVLGRWCVCYLCLLTFSAHNQVCHATMVRKKENKGVKCQTITFELKEFSLFENFPSSPPMLHYPNKSKLCTWLTLYVLTQA